MAKDPALLFYTNDFLSGTFTMTNEEVGKYIRLLCLQHQKTRLSENEFNKVLGNSAEEVRQKFTEEIIGGQKYYFQERLRHESQRRKDYSESRRNNRNKGDNDNVHIYLMHNETTNYVKIGSSVDPNRRLLELSQKDNIYLMCYTQKTSQKAETHLHQKYKDYKVFNEWYDIYHFIHEVKDYMINDMKLHMSTHMETETITETVNETNHNKGLHLFKNSPYNELTKFKEAFYSNTKYLKYDYTHYYEAVKNWSESSNKKKANWIATAYTWARNDKTPHLLESANWK